MRSGLLSLLIHSFLYFSSETCCGLLILIYELQLLLERGANLEAMDEDGAIPLHDACAGGSLNYQVLIVELLKFIG